MEKKDHVLLGAALTVGAVEDWLGEHVDPETGYVVDDTLAIEGAAADSKATGDAIAAVEAAIPAVDATLATTGAAADAKKTGDEIADLKSAIYQVGSVTFYQYGLDYDTGKRNTTTTAIHSNWLDDRVWSVASGTNYLVKIIAYSTDGSTCYGQWDGTQWTKSYSSSAWMNTININELRTAYPNYIFRLVIGSTNSSTLTPADAANQTFVFSTSEDLAAEAQDKINAVDGIEYFQFNWGHYLQTNGSTVDFTDVKKAGDENYGYAVMNCQHGDIFTLNTTGGYSNRAWAFVDASNNVLSNSAESATTTNLEIAAPFNAAKIVIHAFLSQKSYKGIKINKRVSDLEQEQSGEINASGKADLGWVIGTLNYGQETTGTERARSTFIKVGKGTKISANPTYVKFIAALYDINTNKFIADNGAWVTEYTVLNDCYLRLLIAKPANGVISDADLETMTANVFVYRKPVYSDLTDSTIITDIPENVLKYREAKATSIKRKNESVTENCDARLMWITDVHGDNERIKRVAQLVDNWSLFDALICTGDIVAGNRGDGYAYFFTALSDLSVPYYNTLGNHDAYTSGTTLGTAAQAYEVAIASMRDLADVEQPEDAAENGYCYYYVDINGVRVIVLDAIYWDSTQKTWFESVLADAKENSLPVLALTHCSFPWANMTWVDSQWSKSGIVSVDDGNRMDIEAATAVKDFTDDGGEFICWLTGHNHNDDLHKLESYGNQFVVTADAFTNRVSFDMKSSDKYDYNYDLMTYVTIDTTLKHIKFLRIGANIDLTGTRHDGLCIDYANKKLVSSW